MVYLKIHVKKLKDFRRMECFSMSSDCVFFVGFVFFLFIIGFLGLGQWPVELPLSFMCLVGSGVVMTAKPARW